MLDSITKGYLALRPAAAAQTLARLDSRDTKAIFEAMPHQLAAKVLEQMTPVRQPVFGAASGEDGRRDTCARARLDRSSSVARHGAQSRPREYLP